MVVGYAGHIGSACPTSDYFSQPKSQIPKVNQPKSENLLWISDEIFGIMMEKNFYLSNFVCWLTL